MRKGDNTHLNANVKMVRANDCTDSEIFALMGRN